MKRRKEKKSGKRATGRRRIEIHVARWPFEKAIKTLFDCATWVWLSSDLNISKATDSDGQVRTNSGELMIIGIIGTRRRDTGADYDLVKAALERVYKDGDELVSGGCPQGGDRFAELLAKRMQIPIKIYYAEWDKRGRSAGYYRNTFIVRDANVLIACVASDRTGGTEDTIRKFLNEKVEDKLILV